jgi:hypothetical protein
MRDVELNKHDNSICPLEIVARALIAITRVVVVERIGLGVVGPMRKVDARHADERSAGDGGAGAAIRWRI